MLNPSTALPVAEAVSGPVLAVTVALAVTALVAVAMVFARFARTRHDSVPAIVGTGGVLAILAGVVVIGGTLAPSPVAPPGGDRESGMSGRVELPTLPVSP